MHLKPMSHLLVTLPPVARALTPGAIASLGLTPQALCWRLLCRLGDKFDRAGSTWPRFLSSLLVLILGSISVSAQEVRDTSYTASTGERVLRIETILPISVDSVWLSFSTPKGLSSWVAPVVSLDLRTGGMLSTNYDKNAAIGSPGTIYLPILNYLDGEMITFKVNLNEAFPKKVREEDKNLQEIIQLVKLGNQKTKVVSSMVGWGQGKQWEDTFNFFSKGNRWTYTQLVKAMTNEKQR
jgi:hypothetical protein